MTAAKAREELSKLESAKSFADYVEQHKDAARFKTKAKADDAKSMLGAMQIAAAVPIFIELASLLYDVHQGRKQDAGRADRRASLQQEVRAMAMRSADATWRAWLETAQAFRQWIQQRSTAAEASRAALQGEVALAESSLVRIGDVLGSASS